MVAEPLSVIDKPSELRLKFTPDAEIQNAISFMEQVVTSYEELRNLGNTKLGSAEECVAACVENWSRIDTYLSSGYPIFPHLFCGWSNQWSNISGQGTS